MMSFQTQPLLHSLHLHLTVSEASCPKCNKTSLRDFVCQFSVTLESHAAGVGIYIKP